MASFPVLGPVSTDPPAPPGLWVSFLSLTNMGPLLLFWTLCRAPGLGAGTQRVWPHPRVENHSHTPPVEPPQARHSCSQSSLTGKNDRGRGGSPVHSVPRGAGSGEATDQYTDPTPKDGDQVERVWGCRQERKPSAHSRDVFISGKTLEKALPPRIPAWGVRPPERRSARLPCLPCTVPRFPFQIETVYSFS